MNPEALRSLFSAPPLPTLLVLAVTLTGAAWIDFRFHRIPNWLNLAGFLLGFAVNIAIGPPDAGFLFALKGFLIGFGLYMLLYVVRASGAGDVKLMGAVGAILGAQRWFGLFLVTAIVGGAMGLLLAALRGRLKRTLFNVSFILSEMKHARPAYAGKEELDVRTQKGLALPRGTVTAVAALFYLGICAWLGR